MLLLELMSKEDGIKRIAEFMDNWQWGRYTHTSVYAKQVPPGIFALIRHFIPESIYTGSVYRSTGFTPKEVFAAANVKALLRTMKDFQHSNNSQYYAWSKTAEGVMEWLSYGEGDAEEMSPGEEYIQLFVTQKTTHGIDVAVLEQKLIEYDALDAKTRASYVKEVFAPLEPPLHPLEFSVQHPGAPEYSDDEGYPATKATHASVRNWGRFSTFHAGEFNQMKKFLKGLSVHGKNEQRWHPRASKFTDEPDDE